MAGDPKRNSVSKPLLLIVAAWCPLVVIKNHRLQIYLENHYHSTGTWILDVSGSIAILVQAS